MIFEKEILTPVSDILFQSPWNIRYTTFRFGPMFVHFVLKDMTALPKQLEAEIHTIEDYRTGRPFEFKKYLIFCIINDTRAYIYDQQDEKDQIVTNFIDVIQRLKFGENVEINDQAGMYESVQLSYSGIKWLWE